MTQSILNDLFVRLGSWFNVDVWSIVVQILRLSAVSWGGGGAGDGCGSVLSGSSVAAARPWVYLW